MNEKKAPKISFIIIYTKDEQIKECEKWIDAQNYDGEIEKIILDNRENKGYKSAASALNFGAKKSTGDILFFMHQDVYLWDKNAIKTCVDFLTDNTSAIIGAAGIGLDDGQSHYNIFMDEKRKQYAWRIDKPLKAATLDECLLVMKKNVWEDIGFDEITCDNWHFYGADICYVNTENGGENFIMPLDIMHDSRGTPYGKEFRRSAYNLARKHEGKIKRIETTIINSKCSVFGVWRWFFKRQIKTAIKFCLKITGLLSLADVINKKRKMKKGLFVESDDLK